MGKVWQGVGVGGQGGVLAPDEDSQSPGTSGISGHWAEGCHRLWVPG